ncbi:ABC transporter substrate-binding protein [Salmonella enterica subsp. enterica]|nr:ABC transporter substrate-binding protein [Salmonella enterica]ECS5198532.1 ABC transporter substrate-binding protein [Salmonella enterica subsp. enterica serovar Poano]EEP4632529.1 ABC transporter substrate-binding protein [Salmonella enterica subsp. enterica serovar Poano]
MIRLACVACMDERRSVHTPTYLRAVELAQELLLPEQVSVRLFDDGASAEGAARAAQEILTWAPDAIVGHFASSAADAAAPLYAQHRLPLFLPAATAKHLTRYPTTWRLCDNDEDYAAWLRQLFKQPDLARFISDDGSVHGKSVTRQLAGIASTARPEQAKTVIYAGSYQHALAWAVRWTQQSPADARLILGDDAWSAELVPALLSKGVDLSTRQIFVAAMMPQPAGEQAIAITTSWRQRWDGLPGCYFWETLAALQVACRYPDFPAQTVLGKLSFTAQRESHPHSFSLWQATNNGLQVVATPEIRL